MFYALSRLFYNFADNFKFAPTYAELEAKLEQYVLLNLKLEDELEEAYEEEVKLLSEADVLDDIAVRLFDELEAKSLQVGMMKGYIAELEQQLKEVNAKLNFIKGVVCN